MRRNSWWMPRGMTLGAALLVIALSACTPRVGPAAVTPDATADLSSCGSGMGFVLGVGRAIAPALTMLAAANNELSGREGYLRADATAMEQLAAVLEPLDIILISRRHTIGGRIVPGFLTHVALYTGTETQLRALDMWNDSLISPHHDKIIAGAHVIEANAAPVALVTVPEAVDADSVVILRQPGLSARARQDGLHTAFSYHGTPFDTRFDAVSPDRVFCTELVDRALPHAELPHDRIAGHAMILPDRVAQVALEGTAPLDLVLFLYSDGSTLHQGDAARLRATIAANWPIPATPAPRLTVASASLQ